MFAQVVDWLDAQPEPRRRLYGALIALMLLTVPCYAVGALMLAFTDPVAAPTGPPPASPGAATATGTLEPEGVPTLGEPSESTSAAPTAVRRGGEGEPAPTATALVPEPSATPAPSATSEATPTSAALATASPTAIIAPPPEQPSETPTAPPASPTAIPVPPTDTPGATEAPTEAPTSAPTDAPTDPPEAPATEAAAAATPQGTA